MTYLQESVMTLESGMMYVSTITPMSIESYMRLPAATIKALQIFQEDYHPNVIKGLLRLNYQQCLLLFLVL